MPGWETLGDPLGSHFMSRYRVTQPRPWVEPLPTTSMDWSAYTTNATDYPTSAAAMQAILMQGRQEMVELATNKAIRRFNENFAVISNMALTVLERKQSIDMIAKRGAQLLKFARQLKKLDFKGAARTLGIKQPKRASRSKQFADNWLEYHFGWSPLINDIGEAVKVLSKDPPPLYVRGRGTQSGVNRSSNSYVDYPSPQRSWNHQYKARVTIGCRIVRVNPDLALANSLGFTDPATLVWESIPFSFVVDWFANVNEFLSQFSNTIGYTLDRKYTKILYEASGSESSFKWIPMGETSGKGSDNATGRGWEFKRELGLPLVSLKLKPFRGFSPTRGATAISLLLQFLHKQ